ncbi:hypothetical protein [Paenibacillus sp. KN14-4R]|uniref:hypothetical protein n=1 Tax=Paenibacillus sp. KN14-4R TaxID=3445773 RepID=UPI003FA0215E
MSDKQEHTQSADSRHEGRDKYFMDVDRMISEGLGGGLVTEDNGKLEDSTTDTMMEIETILNSQQR